jgi:hypothetical protein
MAGFLNLLGELSGLMNAVFMPVAFYICWRMNEGFRLVDNTISSCGAGKKSGRLFNLSLTMAGVLQTAFVATILYDFSLLGNLWLSVPPIVAGIFMTMSGIVSTKVNSRVHFVLASAMFCILIPWSIIFHMTLLQTNWLVGAVSSAISLVLAVGTVALFIKYKVSGIPEVFFLSIVILWNLFFSIVLLSM